MKISEIFDISDTHIEPNIRVGDRLQEPSRNGSVYIVANWNDGIGLTNVKTGCRWCTNIVQGSSFKPLTEDQVETLIGQSGWQDWIKVANTGDNS